MKGLISTLLISGAILGAISVSPVQVEAESVVYPSDMQSIPNDKGTKLYIMPFSQDGFYGKTRGGAYNVRQRTAVTENGMVIDVFGEEYRVNIDGYHPLTSAYMMSAAEVILPGAGSYEYYAAERTPGYFLDDTVYTLDVPLDNPHDYSGTEIGEYAASLGQTVADYLQLEELEEDFNAYTFPKLDLVLGDIEFVKVDAFGEPLAGAQFMMVQTSDARGDFDEFPQITGEVVTDETGIVRFENLPEGTYNVVEVTSPEGYGLNSNAQRYEVTVSDLDPTQVVVNQLDEDNEPFPVVNESDMFINHENPDFDAHVQTPSTNGEALPDAYYTVGDDIEVTYLLDLPTDVTTYDRYHLELYMSDKVDIDSVVDSLRIVHGPEGSETDLPFTINVEDRTLLIDLTVAEYPILEVARLTFNPQLMVDEVRADDLIGFDMIVSWSNGKGDGGVAQRAATITAKEGVIDLTKIDASTAAGLEGATFKLYKHDVSLGGGILPETDADYVVHEGKYYLATNNPRTGEAFEAISDEEGKLLFESVPFGEYALVETSAPEGYRLREEPIILTVEDTDEAYNTEDGRFLIDVIYVQVTNTKTAEFFPGTGTTGNILVVIAATTLLSAAAFVGRKKREEA